MPKARKFKASSGGHLSIYVPWRAEPIEIMEGGVVETDDPREIEALKGAPEAVEVKEQTKDQAKARKGG